MAVTGTCPLRAVLLALPLAALLAACGGSGASAGSATVRSQGLVATSPAADPALATVRPGATPASLGHALTVARHVYANEVNGARVHHDLGLLAGDQVLLGDLASGDFAAAQEEALHEMMSDRTDHITRVSVTRGTHVLVNATWNPNGSFVVAPLRQGISLNGRSLGSLQVSVQDVIGYVKLVHLFTGAVVVVRGSSGQVRTSLPATAHVTLPSAGSVMVGGRRYRLGSFRVGGWGGEALTVSLLVAA